ncbi:MAG: putative rane protein [Herbinix sp.]|jgi:hypothetical protein|nr:putative rane protein [Herbinix sp.]
MQYKITRPSRLLNAKGELIQKGYSTAPILKYTREDVARKIRLKEWDYYLIYNEDYAVALTVGKSNALFLISVSLLNLKNKKEITKSVIRIVPNRMLTLPESSQSGDIIYKDKNVDVSFLHHGRMRDIHLFLNSFTKDSPLEVSFQIAKEPKDSMVIATPFPEDKKAFYYNRKIIGMRTLGSVRYKSKVYTFQPYNSFALLDWGRGVWPYKTTWYWGAGQGLVNGNLFGFNLGYGFGNTSAATENMLFFNGKASKLEDITFHIPRNCNNEYDYLKPWAITSSDHRFEMEFIPILDRSVNLSALMLSTNQHQVFGKYSGYAVLEDGIMVYIKDFLGFAERVENRW